jgi:hypothetical protein
VCLLFPLVMPAARAGAGEVSQPPGAIDGRGYELVSQPQKNGYQVAQLLPISDDGRRTLYRLFSGGAPGSTSGQAAFVATRTATGWVSQNAEPPRDQMLASTYVIGAATPDLARWIGSAIEGFGTTDQSPDVSVARLDDAGGQQLLHTFPTYFGLAGVPVVSSDDLSHVLAAVPRGSDPSLPGYLPGAFFADEANVFDLGSDPPALVDRMPLTGQPPACGVNGLGGTMDFPGGTVDAVTEHWISSDGSSAFFSTSGDVCSDPRQLYVRDLRAGTTRLVSGPPLAGDPDHGIDRFLQATPDGAQAFFRTTTSYDPADDADASADDSDIYRWTASSGALTCITCAVPSANVPPTGGNTVANAVVSEDGSHVYFPSVVQAADAPGPGTSSAPNLYRWRSSDDSLHYVGRITVGDGVGGLGNVPYAGGETTPDGAVLIFRSEEPQLDALSGASNQGHFEYYRYDDRDGSLTCVSCPPGGAAATDVPVELASGNTRVAVASRARAVTDDGSMVFFATRDALVPEDVNGTWDVYEWHDGAVGLITNGLTHYPGSVQPYPVGASADGRDFLFEDVAQLTWDAQDSAYKAYDARIGGGFPAPPVQPGCDGGSCQGAPASPPPLSDPGSTTFAGAGNVPPPARFAVVQPSLAQLRRVARGGTLRLAVRVDRPGRVSAFAQARIVARIRVVARGAARARRAGRVTLALRLSRAARTQLATRGRLSLVLAVSFSKARASVRLSLTLRAAVRRGR